MIMSDIEKPSIMHKEYARNGAISEEDAQFLADFSEERRKKVLRKVCSTV